MAIALVIFYLLLTGLGVYRVKLNNQKARDKQRITYRISFPSDLEAERVAAWLRSISGTLRGSLLSGSPTVCFELWATHEGIEHHLKVPWQHADYIIMQLRSLVPGIRVTPDDGRFETWTKSVEVGLTQTSGQLRIYNPSDTSHSILSAVQSLEQGEAIVIQWVATPAPPRHLPIQNQATTQKLGSSRMASRDEVNDRREKLSEPNVMAVLRVGAKAKTDARADHLIYRVRSAHASFHSASSKFRKRFVSKEALQKRIDNASAALTFPAQLSTSEMAALIAWPIGNPFVAGLPQSLARHLPVTEMVPRIGRVIGQSNMPGHERPIAIGYEDALKHFHVVGPTGTGKTSLLANMLKQDIEQGYGVVLIESKGDLFNTALDYIPPDRIQDVIVMDVNDTNRPIGFNILNQGDAKVVVDEISALFDYLYDTSGVWSKEVLYFGLRTLASDPKLAFVDLAPLLAPNNDTDKEWRDALIRSLTDQEIRMFWQRFDSQGESKKATIAQPVMDRIWQLNARPELRNIIGQSTSSFQMSDVITNSKILLVNLSGLAGDTASLTGTLVMNALWQAVKTSKPEKMNYLYLDEFQSFLRLPVDPEDMLAKARSFGLGMVLAHQHLDQLPKEMRQAVLANARSKIVFQTSNADAQVMAREFGSSVTADDFMHLGRYEAIARVATGDGVSQPFTLASKEPARGYGRAGEVKHMSRQAHGRPVSEIEKEIAKRRSVDEISAPRKKSRLSGEDWGR